MLIKLLYHASHFSLLLILFKSSGYCTSFDPIAEVVNPIGILSEEVKAELETIISSNQKCPVIREAKFGKYSIQFRNEQTFLYFLLIFDFVVFL